MKTTVIILAAGSSSRMGQPKQTLDVGGEKLLVRTVRTFLQSGLAKPVIVLGSDEKAHRSLVEKLPVVIVYNPDWAKGMGSSIKAGVDRVTAQDPSIEAVIVSVCDQPLLSREHIMNLISARERSAKPIIASEYSNVPGVPVLFDKRYFETLKALPDDQGAKKIVLQHPSDVDLVPFPGGEIDLDTMDDYERFTRT